VFLKLNHVSQLIFSNNNKHASVARFGLNIYRPLYIKTRFINHLTGRILEIILLFAHILNLHKRLDVFLTVHHELTIH